MKPGAIEQNCPEKNRAKVAAKADTTALFLIYLNCERNYIPTKLWHRKTKGIINAPFFDFSGFCFFHCLL
jgi:hypothetical protein